MELAKHWRQRATRYRLEGERNTRSGEIRFPAAEGALDENAAEWQPYALSGKGEVYSFSAIHQPPEGFEGERPYIVAMVRLSEGPMITAQITDCPEGVEIGQPVEMVTRRLRDTGKDGLLIYGYKFRPLLD